MANVAVAVHGAFRYVLVGLGDEALIVEKSLCQQVLSKADISEYKVIKEFSGDDLTQLHYRHPFAMANECRVVLADYVTKEDPNIGCPGTDPGPQQQT